jgi:carbon-monoxide dehydrogenase small subunit
MLAAQAQGAEVTTIEGLAAADGTLHPMQAAFKRLPRPAVRLLHPGHGDERGRPGAAPRAAPASSRCARRWKATSAAAPGYHNIVKAVQQGAAAMK